MQLATNTLLPIINRGKPVKVDDQEVNEKIIKLVCDFYGIERKVLLGRGRRKTLCLSRHIIAYLSKANTTTTCKRIGEMLGGRDHTTCVNSIKQMNGWLTYDEKLIAQVKLIQALI